MRKAVFLVSIFFAVLCLAQLSAGQASSTTPTHSRHRAMPGGERSMRGCIVKNDSGDYLLAPLRGVKVRLNSSDDVMKHLGQQVKVSGAFVDADDDAATTPGSPNANDHSKPRVVREFRVVKVDVISQTCPAPPTRKK